MSTLRAVLIFLILFGVIGIMTKVMVGEAPLKGKESSDPSGRSIYNASRDVGERRGANVSLSLNKKEFSSGDTLVMTINNDGEKEISFGQSYAFEYLEDGEWREARWLNPWVWLSVLYVLKPGDSFNQTVELFPVRSGFYRVSKRITVGAGEEEISDTFEVVEGTPPEEIPRAWLPEEFWQELHGFCSSDVARAMSNEDIRVHLNNMISKAIADSDPEHEIFLAYGGGSQSVSLAVKHATREFIEKWPPECHGVEFEINVLSWALTEDP